MLPSKIETFVLQQDLGLYCRTGIDEPETSNQNNTYQYRRIVFNVVKDTLKTAFPIARNFVGKKKWKKMVKHFFSNHKCQTPQVWKLPLEFCEFYTENSFPFEKKYIFLLELLQFEWLEIDVFMMEDEDVPPFVLNPTPTQKKIVGNPEIKILSLSYPVHLKKAKNITEQDLGQYFVTIHRDLNDKQVYFNDLSYPFIEMLVAVNEGPTTVNDFEIIYSKYETDKIIIRQTVEEFIEFAKQNQILLGFN